MPQNRWLPQPPLAAVVQINANLLLAASMAFFAWVCWPTSPGWWQATLISVILAIMAVTALVQAAALAFKVYSREREIAAMLASGRTHHPANLASARDLRRPRMTDD